MTDDTIATWMQRYPEPRARKAKPRKDLRAAEGIFWWGLAGVVFWSAVLYAVFG